MRRGVARGLSYLELLLVVAMMSVLTTLVLPTGITINRRIKEKELQRGLRMIRSAIDQYHRDWERGCIESDDEAGWPKDLEELRDGVQWQDLPQCQPEASKPGSGTPEEARGPRRERPRPADKKKIEKKVYLPRVPRDPFNRENDELDTMGWRALSYEDEPDSTTWKGEGLYDVRSVSELTALDGTKYSTW